MKKALKKILIMCVAVACAFCMHLSVSAEGGLFGDVSIEDLSQMIQDLFTKTTEPEETTVPSDVTTDPNATTDSDATTDPVNNSGTGSLTTETTTYTNNYVPDNGGGNTYPTEALPTTTEPAGDESQSFDYNGSLSDWLEADSAAIIVQKPSETYTINGLVVNNGDDDDDSDDGISWMQIAIVASGIMLVILFALVVALIAKKKRNNDDDDEYTGHVVSRADEDDDTPKGPVTVEVMSADRIAELLGSAKKAKNSYAGEATVRDAILMDQLTQSYSDPLIRKYTDEPVRMSPIANINVNDDVSAADILKATESMLDDITGKEKYASDISGVSFLDDDIASILENTETKVCPDCNAPVSSSDIFCHSCGAYVG